jgi:hypothetical protein
MVSSPDRRLSNFFGVMAGRLIARWREWTAPDRYRPEKHYMRGPGPKNLANSAKAGGHDPKANMPT